MISSRVYKFDSISIEKVKAVLLDLDNTIYSHDPCHDLALEACWDYMRDSLAPSCSIELLNKYYQQGRGLVQKRLYPGGSCRSRLLYFQAMLEAMKSACAYGHALTLETLYIKCFLKQMVIDGAALQFLKRCKKNGISVCIVTNLTTQFQLLKIKKLKLESYISCLVSSEEVGVEKPDPLIFQIALKKLNVTVNEVIMIGDDHHKDILGARKLGIVAFTI